MKPVTTNLTESFIFAESPALTGRCAVCGKSVKQTIDDADQLLQLEIGYRIRTIKIYAGGRTFEKVDSSYLHVCPKPLAEAQPDCLRGASVGELALL